MPFVALNTNRYATNEGDMRKHQTYALVTLSENYLRSLSKLTLLKPYFSIQNLKERLKCGGDRSRTCDLMRAKHLLSQLSYAPVNGVGPG